MLTNWKRKSWETPWKREAFCRTGKKRWCEMLERMAFGRPYKVSCCFRPSVLNLRHMWDNIWSWIRAGKWFRIANSEAALIVSLCQTNHKQTNETQGPTSTIHTPYEPGRSGLQRITISNIFCVGLFKNCYLLAYDNIQIAWDQNIILNDQPNNEV